MLGAPNTETKLANLATDDFAIVRALAELVAALARQGTLDETSARQVAHTLGSAASMGSAGKFAQHLNQAISTAMPKRP